MKIDKPQDGDFTPMHFYYSAGYFDGMSNNLAFFDHSLNQIKNNPALNKQTIEYIQVLLSDIQMKAEKCCFICGEPAETVFKSVSQNETKICNSCAAVFKRQKEAGLHNR